MDSTSEPKGAAGPCEGGADAEKSVEEEVHNASGEEKGNNITDATMDESVVISVGKESNSETKAGVDDKTRSPSAVTTKANVLEATREKKGLATPADAAENKLNKHIHVVPREGNPRQSNAHYPRRAVSRKADPPLPDALPRTRLQRQRAIRQGPMPGAYAETTSGFSLRDSDTTQRTFPSVLSREGHFLAEDYTTSLSVACLVDGEGHPDLPRAQAVSASDAIRRQKRTKQITTNVCLVMVTALAIILVLVGVLVPSKGNSYTEQLVPTEAPSNSPSQTPASIEGYVLSLLPEATIVALDNVNSPQARALDWLMGDIDNLVYLSDARITQRFALATLYFATNGDNWAINTNWLEYNIHECDWYNKPSFSMKHELGYLYPFYNTIYPPSEPSPTTCHANGLYQNLWLDQNNLAGSVPDELYLLTSLETLSVGLNHLEGSISSRVGHLTSLRGLAMMHQAFTGTIPTQVGLLTNLEGLGLNGNNLRGSVPKGLWGLSNLESLILGQNRELQVTIPSEIGALSNLGFLLLNELDLTGTIATEIGKLNNLNWTSLGGNRLTGTLPSQLGQLKSISFLSVFGNSLEGPLPTELGLLTTLEKVKLNDNQFTGPVPSEFGHITNLQAFLHLRNNQLSGTIPTQLGLLTQLQALSLANNRLSGDIPSELGRLTSLDQLSLGNNLLSSTLPSELAALEGSLHSLYLEGIPMLSGTVPNALCKISNRTCIEQYLDPDECVDGLSFDCTDLLCGCACHCTGGIRKKL